MRGVIYFKEQSAEESCFSKEHRVFNPEEALLRIAAVMRQQTDPGNLPRSDCVFLIDLGRMHRRREKENIEQRGIVKREVSGSLSR